MSWLKNMALTVTSVVVAVVVIELVLRGLGVGALYQSGINRLHDEVLLYRLPPHHGAGIDAEGFRNATSDGPFDVVVLGDSLTYGYGVGDEESWPAVLARRSGLTVYNYGMGGYGPAQYATLAERALADKRPRWLIVALFMGNDLEDACRIASRLEHWRRYYAEHRIVTPSCGGGEPHAPRARSDGVRLKAWLKQTRIGGMVDRHVWSPLVNEIRFLRAEGADRDRLYVDDPNVRTIIGSHYATAGQDGADGVAIARHFLGEIDRLADSAGVGFAVLLVPSKPNVHREYLEIRGLRLPAHAEMAVAAERRYLAELSRFLDGLGVAHASVLPRLQAALAGPGGPLYPADVDDHPNARGYAIVAETAIAELLPRTGGVSR